MKAATAIGIVVAIVGLLGGAVMEGTSPAAFINIPATLVVIGGTIGVTLASAGMESIKRIPTLYKKVISPEPPELVPTLQQLVSLADRARREGLLALESDLEDVADPFMRKGLQLVVDGTDPELVQEILEAEMEATSARHRAGVLPFEKAGGFAPTMGIIGTVQGLVHVLANLAAPSTLGPAISGAFIATLLGVGSANVVYLPVANRLKLLSEEELEARAMTLEGILAVQAGDNPRIVAEKLMAYIPPALREEASAEPQQPNLRAVPDDEEQEMAA